MREEDQIDTNDDADDSGTPLTDAAGWTDNGYKLVEKRGGEWVQAWDMSQLELKLAAAMTELAAANADLARRTAERDEARREVCRDELHVRMGIYTAKEFAAYRGWNCFKEEDR